MSTSPSRHSPCSKGGYREEEYDFCDTDADSADSADSVEDALLSPESDNFTAGMSVLRTCHDSPFELPVRHSILSLGDAVTSTPKNTPSCCEDPGSSCDSSKEPKSHNQDTMLLNPSLASALPTADPTITRPNTGPPLLPSFRPISCESHVRVARDLNLDWPDDEHVYKVKYPGDSMPQEVEHLLSRRRHARDALTKCFRLDVHVGVSTRDWGEAFKGLLQDRDNSYASYGEPNSELPCELRTQRESQAVIFAVARQPTPLGKVSMSEISSAEAALEELRHAAIVHVFQSKCPDRSVEYDNVTAELPASSRAESQS